MASVCNFADENLICVLSASAMFMPVPSERPGHSATVVAYARGNVAVAEPVSRSQAKKELQERQRAWLREVVNFTGLKASQIADGSGVSDTTLTRLLNNPEYTGTLSQVTIDRIKETYKVPGPEDFVGGRRLSLFGFAEAQRFDASEEPTALAKIITQLIGERPAAAAWRLKTNALEEGGYLAGDIVIVDMNLAPEPQDAVCAQVYDWKGGSAETVFRIYTPPFLVAAAQDRTAYKPLLVDNDRVVIKGVVVESFRPHRLSATR